MKHVGRLAAQVGLTASLWLVVHDNPGAVIGLMRAAGAGLLLAGLAHVPPMLANARDWQSLVRGANRPSLLRMLHLVWIRESVNSMLPVAHIGGEVVSFRMMRRCGLRGSTAAASSRRTRGSCFLTSGWSMKMLFMLFSVLLLGACTTISVVAPQPNGGFQVSATSRNPFESWNSAMDSSRRYARAFCRGRDKGMSEVNFNTFAFPLRSAWEADLLFACVPRWQ